MDMKEAFEICRYMEDVYRTQIRPSVKELVGIIVIVINLINLINLINRYILHVITRSQRN